MAAMKSLIKGVSQVVGEVIVVGGALLGAFALGVVKGSDAKPVVHDVGDMIKKKIDEAAESEKEAAEEPAEEAESKEESAPEITVTVNDQPED